MYEVEKRVILSEKQYNLVKKKLDKYKASKEFSRFSMVKLTNKNFLPNYKDKIDLRIRTTKTNSEVVIKYGEWLNDNGREEVSFVFSSKDFKNVLYTYILLGYPYWIFTYVKREQYEIDNFIIVLDRHTLLNKYILEIEKITKEKHKINIINKEIKNFLLYKFNLKPSSIKAYKNFIEEMNSNTQNCIDFEIVDYQKWYTDKRDLISCNL